MRGALLTSGFIWVRLSYQAGWSEAPHSKNTIKSLSKRRVNLGKLEAMAEITNLNQFRKQRTKEVKRRAAASNKERMGRTKVARLVEKISTERRNLELDGKKFIDRARFNDKDT